MIPRRFFAFIDFCTLYAAFVAAYAVWPTAREATLKLPLPAWLQPSSGGALPPFPDLQWAFLVFALATLFFLGLVEAYKPVLRQSLTRVIASSVFAPVAAMAAVTSVFFATRQMDWSRLFVFLSTTFGAALLLTVRLAIRTYFRVRLEAGFYAKKVVLVGSPQVTRWLTTYFNENVSPTEYKLVGHLSPPPDRESAVSGSTAEETGVERLGDVEDLGGLLVHYPVDEVIAVQSGGGSEWMPAVIESCDATGVLLRIVPEDLLVNETKVLRTLYPFQLLNLPAVVLAPPHLDSDALFLKRAFDVLASAVLLALLAPLFGIIAVAIKISDRNAPVFYRWNVVGRNGSRFTGYKFTTMYADADDRRRDLQHLNEMTGPVFKIKNDPRVTPLGRFLRKYSLNELPQLWSVLKGDMSLVGPRPAFPHELERYQFWQKRKLSIRPGITCLWQIRGRNRISNFDDWVKMDLEYIDNWSLWLDVKILLRTVGVVVTGTGS